jgi:hypothetical protein
LQPYFVSLNGFNVHFIDVLITKEDSEPWHATFLYGEARRDRRHEFWGLMCRLHSAWDGPWICYGDFNEVLTSDEHLGLNDRSESHMSLLRDCLQSCGLVDLGFSGP